MLDTFILLFFENKNREIKLKSVIESASGYKFFLPVRLLLESIRRKRVYFNNYIINIYFFNNYFINHFSSTSPTSPSSGVIVTCSMSISCFTLILNRTSILNKKNGERDTTNSKILKIRFLLLIGGVAFRGPCIWLTVTNAII